MIITATPCPTCAAENRQTPILIADGIRLCWTCDSVEAWPMCQPDPDPEPFTLRRGVEFLLILAACWVPIALAVRWWWA